MGIQQTAVNGVDRLVERKRMSPSAQKLRDVYARVPGAPLFKREFGFYCLERWKEQGMPQDVPNAELFDYDSPGKHSLGQLGWCEAAFAPAFDEKILEDRGEHEVVQDFAGRAVLSSRSMRVPRCSEWRGEECGRVGTMSTSDSHLVRRPSCIAPANFPTGCSQRAHLPIRAMWPRWRYR
jgi:hypothetical protein